MKEPYRGKRSDFTFCLLAVLFALLIVFSRRPDAFTNPQFWAEDGALWYADAYNVGWWKALLVPATGYIQLLPRLSATFALALPLQFAPAVCNAAAIAIQVLPAVFLLSSRFQFAAGFITRLYLSFLYLALPNTSELNANITCAQWHLALLAFLVLIAEARRRVTWRSFDLATVAVCALSGPFPIFLALLAFILFWKYRRLWTVILAAMLSLGAVVQAIVITEFRTSGRSHQVLGATAGRLIKILSGKVFVAAVLGSHDLGSIKAAWNLYLLFAVIVVCFSGGILLYAVNKGRLELKLFVVLGMAILLAALMSPMASMNVPQWYVLQSSRSGLRYWFFPMLVFVTCLVWSAGGSRPAVLRATARTILVLMVVGIVRDWRYPPLADLDFSRYASSFQQAAPGTRFRIPLNPPGWSMVLIKHQSQMPPRRR